MGIGGFINTSSGQEVPEIAVCVDCQEQYLGYCPVRLATRRLNRGFMLSHRCPTCDIAKVKSFPGGYDIVLSSPHCLHCPSYLRCMTLRLKDEV